MEKHSKIFVAGHKGLVGSAIIRNLLDNGYTNILTVDKKDLDLRNQGRKACRFDSCLRH